MKKLSVSFLSHCSVTLFCYSTNPHVKDRQRHKILIWPGVSHIAFCCKGVSARDLSIDSIWRYTGVEVLDLYRSAFDLLWKVKILLLYYSLSYYCVCSVLFKYYTQNIRCLLISWLLSSSMLLFSLFLFFLPGRHPSPCGRPPLLWQLCQCKLLQSVWSGLYPGRAVPAGLPIACSEEPRITNLQVCTVWSPPSLLWLFLYLSRPHIDTVFLSASSSLPNTQG